MEELAYKRDFSGLFCALLFSVGLHLVLLWPSSQVGNSVANAPLSATLVSRPSFEHAGPVLPAPTLSAPQSVVPRPVPPPAPSASTQAASSATASPSTTASSVLVQPRSEGLDAGGLRQYRVGLGVLVQRMGLLRQAVPVGVLGSLQLNVSLLPSGMANQVTLERSSGNAVLDQAALLAVKQAVLQLEVPASLRGNAFTVVVLMEFGD
ncbi:MAG TPA: TonB family protein [Rhodocyclaceae bacterium]|nr:TonB family protein [Rhodocyclaceae bacterium]